MDADFAFEDHGSIWLCRPLNAGAEAHLSDHASNEAQWWGEALVVEPRYVDGLINGLRENGWEV